MMKSGDEKRFNQIKLFRQRLNETGWAIKAWELFMANKCLNQDESYEYAGVKIVDLETHRDHYRNLIDGLEKVDRKEVKKVSYLDKRR